MTRPTWKPSKVAADVLDYIIERWRVGSLASPNNIARHFCRPQGPTNSLLASLRIRGYVRIDSDGPFSVPVVQPLKHADGTPIEGVSPLAGCRVEIRDGVRVTICPPKHVAPPAFRQFGF